MRIAEADVWEMFSEVAQQSRNRYGGATLLERTLIRLRDDEGHEGWGEAMPVSFADETHSATAAALRKAAKDIKGRELEPPFGEIDSLARFSGLGAARSGLEMALLDLECQRSGKPFADALGGAMRSEISLDGPIGLIPPAEAARKVVSYLDEGLSTFKVKVGGDLDADAKRLLFLREAFGEKINLRMDANGGYSAEEALKFCKKIQPAHVEHFEQPVLPTEKNCLEVFEEIREMGIPIAVDESLFSLEDAERLLGEGAVDVGVIKIAKFGGALAAREVARAFEAAGKTAIVSCSYESFIGKAAGMALALSLESAGRVQEVGHFAKEAEFAEWRHRIEGGTMRSGEGAGLGARGLADKLSALEEAKI
jgi:o-succinylbenzoate synthase